MGEFAVDPMTFLSQVSSRIKSAKNQVVAKGIKYTRRPQSEWYMMDIFAVRDLRAYLDQNAWAPHYHKSLYNYVVYDSSSIEKPYAVELDRSEQVKVFAKLPKGFKIDTPLGSYNPDWTYVEEGKDGRQRVLRGGDEGQGARREPPDRGGEDQLCREALRGAAAGRRLPLRRRDALPPRCGVGGLSSRCIQWRGGNGRGDAGQ